LLAVLAVGTRHVARSQAEFSSGAYSTYHLVYFGFILGEVVRRVSVMPVDQYLMNTFFEPMGLEHTWMRLPPDKLRLSPQLLALRPQMRAAARLFNLPVIR
jgi:CubicO group peptidase (beta-lactamase class C family)